MPDNSGNVTAFDKAHYDQLITYLNGVDDNVNTDPTALGPSADLKLDPTLSTMFKPGSQNWDVVKNLLAKAGAFGNSAHTRYTTVEQDVRTFVNALKGAEDVFENTNDLATYDAGKFESDYPDVAGAGT